MLNAFGRRSRALTMFTRLQSAPAAWRRARVSARLLGSGWPNRAVPSLFVRHIPPVVTVAATVVFDLPLEFAKQQRLFSNSNAIAPQPFNRFRLDTGGVAATKAALGLRLCVR